MRTSNVQSTVCPQALTVTPLPGGRFEIMACQDITESQGESGPVYTYTMYLSAEPATDYNSMVQAIMHTRYSYDDEMGIINDYLAGGSSAEYSQYTQYRAAAKTEAAKIFEKDGADDEEST